MAKGRSGKRFVYLTEMEKLALLDDPDGYSSLSEEELDQFVFFAIGVYGMTCRAEMVPKIINLYPLFLERVAPDQRLRNYSAVRDLVVKEGMSVNGLFPYLVCDDNNGIVSSAALDFAVLHPLKDQDVLTGPKSLLRMIRQGTITNRAAAFGGLVMLGDQRVMDLLKQIRHELNASDVKIVSHCLTGYIFSAVVDFYVSWLEDLQENYDDRLFGIIAAAICNLVRGVKEPVVRSIERVFPSTPENCIRLLASWPLEDYAEALAPRLRAIAAWEKEPRIMPDVLEVWGLTRDKEKREALEILSKGTVAFRHSWESRGRKKTIEVVELDGRYALRGEKPLGPFDNLYEALSESEMMDELDEAGYLVGLNSCIGTGSMIGDGDTRIYEVGGMYLISDDWGYLEDYGPFEDLEDAFRHCDFVRVNQYTNISCSEISTEDLVQRLECYEDEPFQLTVNDEEWEWDGEQFRRVREDEPGADEKRTM
jgi:hypothetical protein